MLIGGSLLVVAVLVAVFYWLFIVAEGAYLGTPVVTLTYDLTATRYDGIKQFDADFEAAFLGRPLAYALEMLPAPYVLDVGTGTARLPLALFAQPSFDGRVVGLDSSRRMLKVAAEKVAPFGDRIDLIWLDAARLPFPDMTFDAVTCLEMLEFTPNPAAQVAEVVRVLRAGGVLMTTRRRGLDARLMPGKTNTKAQLTQLLESLDMERVRVMPWQKDYDLVWGLRKGGPAPWLGGARPLIEALRCPACLIGTFEAEGSALKCRACGAGFRSQAGVVELQPGSIRAAHR